MARGARLGLLAAGMAILCAPVPASAQPVEPLKSSGRWITDAQGRVVVLHGVNLVTKRTPALPSAAGFGPDDAAYLASEGFNAVRMGFDYKAIEPASDAYDTAFLTSFASEAQAVADQGLFVLADVHQDMYADRYQGNGFPDFMVIDDGQPNAPLSGFPSNYFTNPALNHSFDNFWANADAADGDGLQDHYAEGLTRLAAALSHNSGVLGYEAMNEPWPGTPWSGCFYPNGCPGPGGFDATLLTSFTDRAVAAIRAGDPNRIAFYEPALPFDYGAPTGVLDGPDPNTGFSFHNYCFNPDPSTDPLSCATSEEQVLDNADAHVAATRNAPLMTEFGASDLTSRMERIADAADRHMIGWTYWTYSNIFAGNDFLSESLIKDLDLPPTPDNIKQPALDALARPYPRLVAGTPRSWKWDAGTFELAYSTTGPGGEAFPAGSVSEVFVPKRHFPSGYDAIADGARVASGEGSALLRLESCPGATEVTLKVGSFPEEKRASAAASSRDCDRPCGRVLRVAKGGKRPNASGGPLGERLIGDRRANRLKGRGGGDCLKGLGGRDRLFGGRGDDRLMGGRGHDKLFCGKGRDVAIVGRGDFASKSCERVRRRKR